MVLGRQEQVLGLERMQLSVYQVLQCLPGGSGEGGVTVGAGDGQNARSTGNGPQQARAIAE